jgi:hypothetical protein
MPPALQSTNQQVGKRGCSNLSQSKGDHGLTWLVGRGLALLDHIAQRAGRLSVDLSEHVDMR